MDIFEVDQGDLRSITELKEYEQRVGSGVGTSCCAPGRQLRKKAMVSLRDPAWQTRFLASREA
jgi:hypothetical protein